MPAQEINSSTNNLPNFLTQKEIKYINQYQEYVKTHKIKQLDTDYALNMKKKLDDVSREQIYEVKKQVLFYIKENSSKLKITERFLRELTLNNYLKAYIARHESTKVVEKIIDAMQFLSSIDGIDDDNIPIEFLQAGINIGTGFDVYGNPVFYILAKRNLATKKLVKISEKYITYIIFQIIRISLFTNNFFTLVVDLSGASIGNVDFNGLQILIKIFNISAPLSLNRFIVHNMNWMLRPAFKTFQAILPSFISDIMYITNDKEINKFIRDDQLLIESGGLNNEIILGRPKKNGISFIDISYQLNITKEEAIELIKQYIKILKKNNFDLLAFE